jgi:hypothetical protein
MKKSIASILALLALCAAPTMAVPSGINYQGALTDDQGNPITGTRTMSIKLYDAATAGTLIYSESIGTVDVSDGVFSFEFGTNGTSNAERSETVVLTDGTATTFQKVLSSEEVIAGSVSVSDGTYTWSQATGSSNENDFGASYSTSLRRVTVTYYNGAPASGRTITATYRSPASGIAGALAGDNQPWAEITVDGVAQVPRQKVLAVPFALKASSVDVGYLGSATKRITIPIKQVTARTSVGGGDVYGQPNSLFPIAGGAYYNSNYPGFAQWQVPDFVKRIYSIRITYDSGPNPNGTNPSGRIVLGFRLGPSWPDKILFAQPTPKTETVPVDLAVPFGESWLLKMELLSSVNSTGGFINNTGARILELSVDAEVWAGVVP